MVQTDGLHVGVVTGSHRFDVAEFYAMLYSLDGITFYPQYLGDFATDTGGGREGYDAVVFYNYQQQIPSQEAGGTEGKTRQALGLLGQSKQGIVLLHHGLVAYKRWQHWSNICGLEDRTLTTHTGQIIGIEVVEASHPITLGLGDWEMVDETYAMAGVPRGSQVLLATKHPRSMRSIAWTREFGQARVFCYQSGHDRQAYADASFQTVLARGIRWAAGRI